MDRCTFALLTGAASAALLLQNAALNAWIGDTLATGLRNF
jgi:hypothetical protein